MANVLLLLLCTCMHSCSSSSSVHRGHTTADRLALALILGNLRVNCEEEEEEENKSGKWHYCWNYSDYSDCSTRRASFDHREINCLPPLPIRNTSIIMARTIGDTIATAQTHTHR